MEIGAKNSKTLVRSHYVRRPEKQCIWLKFEARRIQDPAVTKQSPIHNNFLIDRDVQCYCWYRWWWTSINRSTGHHHLSSTRMRSSTQTRTNLLTQLQRFCNSRQEWHAHNNSATILQRQLGFILCVLVIRVPLYFNRKRSSIDKRWQRWKDYHHSHP